MSGSIPSREMVERNGTLDWSCKKTGKTVKSGANTTRVPIEFVWMIDLVAETMPEVPGNPVYGLNK
jgi:ribosomal protein L37AE/L43A